MMSGMDGMGWGMGLISLLVLVLLISRDRGAREIPHERT